MDLDQGRGCELHAHSGRDWIVFFILYFLWFRSRTKKTGIRTEAGGVNYTHTAAEIGLYSLFYIFFGSGPELRRHGSGHRQGV
jgi:hypothetical protein